MISSKYNCLFVHIPKTAGQSIEKIFLDLHGLDTEQKSSLLLRYNPNPQMGPERLAHLTASEYVKYGYLAADKFEKYFKFTFVRNPWERLVSEYLYRKYYRRFNFKKFVFEKFPEISTYSDEYRHLMPQCEFLFDNSGKLLVDFVGRFEELQTDFNKICHELGILSNDLPYVNSSRKVSVIDKVLSLVMPRFGVTCKSYTKFYDYETIKFVERFYSNDIENFRYSFDGFCPR